MTRSIYPVTFNEGATNGHIVFVAFDKPAADRFAHSENMQAECDILTVDELPLVDNYGFPCAVRDAAIVAPWVAAVSDSCAAWYAPKSWARYVDQMSMGG